MGPDIFDLAIALTLAYFTFRGFGAGLIGEIAGIAALVCGFWGARAWNSQLAPYLDFISNPSWRVIAACILIFIAIMLAIGLLARLLKKIIAFSFAGWVDKTAGALLGLVKGVLIWALAIMVLEKLFPNANFIQDSRALPYFQGIIEQIQHWLPPEFSQRLGL